MTPEDALRFWEEAHFPLSEAHKESFKNRVEELGLTEYLGYWFKAAVRQEQRLVDIAELLEEKNTEIQGLKGKLNIFDNVPWPNGTYRRARRHRRSVLGGAILRPDPVPLLTPEDALRFWEEAHYPLSEAHKESFKKRVQQLGLTKFEYTKFVVAVRRTPLLAEVRKILESTLGDEPF